MKKTELKKETYKRPSWDEYFMKIASLVSERSTCLRHHVGAIIVKDKRVLTTGYNGAPSGIKDCLEMGECIKNKLKINSGGGHDVCPAIHAEQNAIIQAAKHGEDISGGTIYCTHTPCIICARMIVNSGLKKVVAYVDYPDMGGVRDLFKKTGVELVVMERPEGRINFLD